MKPFICCLIFLSTPSVCFAQNRLPEVGDIFKQYDVDNDDFLTKKEVAKNERYSRQFNRWDANQDAKVSRKEIDAMRAKFGLVKNESIASQRSEIKIAAQTPNQATLSVPEIADLVRVDRQSRAPRELARQSAYLLKTKAHAVAGNGYAILTDHSDKAYLQELRRLAKHHGGKLISVENLAELYKDKKSFADTAKRLNQAQVKYVAIAPRLESFRENMVLSMWELLSTLDDDPQLDCFPGFLVASNAASFAKLIDQSIAHKPILTSQVKPIAINQVQRATETRSLQKSAMLRKHFKHSEIDTPIIAIYGATASSAPRLEGERTWNLTVNDRKHFLKTFPAAAQSELAAANLVVMHGHGIPGMSCSMDVDAIPMDFDGKILLTGSCFSANPVNSDLAAMREAPGGYQVEPRDAFVLRAIDNGAIVAFGHQRLSSGFPALFPVLESWMHGESVGQGYQELINSLIESKNAKSGDFIVAAKDLNKKRVPQNSFLYVVIGDPAMLPFEPLPSLK